MKLIHTLLFLLRDGKINEDEELAITCLKSLEKSTYTTVVVYNQGYWTNEELEQFLSQFNLNYFVIGEGKNVGTSIGRQKCFEYIWNNFPDTEFISEIHLDMIFSSNWEDKLVDFLDSNNEPMISCGIVDQNGHMNFLSNNTVDIPDNKNTFDDFLLSLRCDKVVPGFTNPCIHVSRILKDTGGYNYHFLKGKQCFEDDSMLLGYYYYYGTKENWHPKVNYNSVVYHAIAGQRLDMSDNVRLNFDGLIKQYGAMGLKHLSKLHTSQWHIDYFNEQYKSIENNDK